MSFSSIKVNSLQRYSLNFSANIIASFWMLFGSVRAFDWVKPSFFQFFCFLTTALLSNVLFAYLVSDLGSEFNVQGLISYLIWPMIMLVAGIIIARRSQNEVLTFVPVILWLTADTLLMLVQSLIQFLGLQGWLPDGVYRFVPYLFMLLFVWQTVSLLVIFAKKLYWNWWERFLMIVASVALLIIWQKNVGNQPIFKMVSVTPTILEQDFYAQAKLLDDTLSGISVGQEGVGEWYFLGVAGYAGQDVFASEIDEARQLFDVRFRSMGRSVSLVNNAHTWADMPIATRTSIERTLNKIGQRMNTKEDVLFLALSSHGVVNEEGVPTGEIAIDNPPLQGEHVNAKWLKETLDKAGIRWRVIVVSACYSGAMIEELLTPTTVVITASRDDRASFGCTHDAELTYFGQAFFADGLRHEQSIEKAFLRAKRRVGEREALMGFTPSEPQMVMGEMMQTYLPDFEQVLFGTQSSSKK